MDRVKCYKVRFFGEEEEIELSQTAGQKLIIYIQENPGDRFVMLNGNLKAISGIKSIDEEDRVVKTLAQRDGTVISTYEIRELTSEERESQKLFDKKFNNLLLK